MNHPSRIASFVVSAVSVVSLSALAALTLPLAARAQSAAGADAQAQADPGAAPDLLALGLTGNRFPPLQFDELDATQQAMVRSVLAGPRNNLGGPFNVMLRSPELGDRMQNLGAYARFNPVLDAKINELAIIMTARYWTAQFEWYVHKNAALRAGLSEQIVDAIATGRRPSAMSPDETAAYDLCNELLNEHRVSDATFATAVETFGERGVVDIIGSVGYYSLVSMLLNVDEYPMPEGVAPELAPLR